MLPCCQPIASDHSMYSMMCLAPHSAVPPNHVLSSHGLAGSIDHLTQLGAPSTEKSPLCLMECPSSGLLPCFPPTGQRPQSTLVKRAGSGPDCLDSDSCLFHSQLSHIASWCLYFLVCKMLTITHGIVVKIEKNL